MLDGTAGSISVTMMSPDSFTSVTCARNEPALICEDNRMPMVGLLALMLSGKWQSRCMMLVCEHRYHPHATPIEPDYDSLIRNIHEYPSGGHFVVLLLFLHTHRAKCHSHCWADALQWPYPISWYLFHTLEIVLGGTANILATANMDVPCWKSWMGCAT